MIIKIRYTIYILLFTLINSQYIYAGVLADSGTIMNGKRNLMDPLFNVSIHFDSGIGDAVNYLLTGEEDIGLSVKVEILRSALSAQENIHQSRAVIEDISSKKLYESLLMFDLISQSGLFNSDERASLKKSLHTVLSHYMNKEIFNWDDDYWILGVSAMRICASCVLYALNFHEDPDSEIYLNYSIRCFKKNLTNSIDDYGAWITDSPGYAGEAVEYMIITAKALKNGGFQDYFSDARLKNLLMYEMHLLPPQQCPLIKEVFMIAGAGQTDPVINHGGNAVIASTDLYTYFPDEASYLIWYWNQCGNPNNPLGVLFIDTSIPYMRPDTKSRVVGGGMAVLSDKYATPKESVLFADFGDACGTFDREGHDHSGHGDFSFVWNGIPLIVHDGYTNDDECSENLMNRQAWRHSLVLYQGAGDSPVVPESIYLNNPVEPDTTGKGTPPADFYPDGISQFLTTELVDYVSGPVRLARSDMPAPFHYRHFLFLKPDALLIWDQVESPFPLEWNVWMPVNNAQAEGNVLKIYSNNNIELNILFAGDNDVNFEIEKPYDEKNWGWPFIMRSEFGSGEITFLSLDLINYALNGSSTFAMDVLQNIIYQYGEPELTGLIAENSNAKEILNYFHLNFDNIEPGEMGTLDLLQYNLLLIDCIRERDIHEHIWKIHDYINSGGNVVWICRSPSENKPQNISGPGCIPVTLGYGYCSVELSAETDIRKRIIITDDPVWQKPNLITPDSWFEWISQFTIHNSQFTIHVPPAWSDSWKVLASVQNSFPVKSYANDILGIPSRIRVKHPQSKDFFTLLLPRITGEPYNFDVISHGPGYVSFANPVTTWEISAGENSWTDANLSVKITNQGGFETLYAFDCTYIDLKTERFTSESPMTIYYSHKEDRGIILTSSKNTIKHDEGEMKLHAGEIAFYGLHSALSIERTAFVTGLHVVDTEGNPVRWARVYKGDRFIGSTDKDGRLPVRWKDQQPEVGVKFRDAVSTGLLVPGKMEIVIDAN